MNKVKAFKKIYKYPKRKTKGKVINSIFKNNAAKNIKRKLYYFLKEH